MEVFARALRRAELPVRMSQGFNPRPRFSLPVPLPLGIEGLDEVLEVDLTEELRAEDVARALRKQMPEGIEIRTVDVLEPGEKARPAGATYRLQGELPRGAVERCAASGELRVTRSSGKQLDIRPYLIRIARRDDGCEFDLRITPGGTARPTEIVAALCPEAPDRARRLVPVRTTVTLKSPAKQRASEEP
jgi:radical SAM-linked protein